MAIFCFTSRGKVSSSSRRSIPATERPFVDRPRHIHKALDAVLADPRFSNRADPDRIGMVGFSFGGAVTLIVAGATIDLAHLSAYCRDHPDDSRACGGIATDGSWAKVPPSPKSDDALPLKALVLLEPYGAPFERKGLASLDQPITDLRRVAIRSPARGQRAGSCQSATEAAATSRRTRQSFRVRRSVLADFGGSGSRGVQRPAGDRPRRHPSALQARDCGFPSGEPVMPAQRRSLKKARNSSPASPSLRPG